MLVAAIIVAMCITGWSVFGQRQAPAPTQWEYFVLVLGEPESSGTGGALKELGIKGWELVSVNDGRAYFKRPVK
jgi:hypothetical protein